jgi:Putative metallopeptidase
MRMRVLAILASLACLAPAVAQAQPARQTDRIPLVYSEPLDPKHIAIREAMQARRILEAAGELLSAFRLPRELTLEVRGCNGRETAWYANDRAVFCYEYVELIQRHSPKVATPGGVTRNDAMVGAVLDTILHEAGHGVIEQLDIPVLGREEDAADFFSIYLMLQFAPDDARRLIEGIAFNMGSEGREDLAEKVRPQMYAGPHAMNAQRHYNVLCLAYGANPALFGDALPAGLPTWRARYCGDEWSLLKRAFDRLVLPHVDQERLRAAIAQVRFTWSPLARGAEGVDRPPLGD